MHLALHLATAKFDHLGQEFCRNTEFGRFLPSFRPRMVVPIECPVAGREIGEAARKSEQSWRHETRDALRPGHKLGYVVATLQVLGNVHTGLLVWQTNHTHERV